jgi:transcriptional regulator with XRE-family HTH domain
MAFGLEFKRLREEAGISAQKLADTIGLDADRLRKWEQKDLTPRFDDAQIIERFFGLSIEKIAELKSIKKFLNVPHGTSNQIIPDIDFIQKTIDRMLTDRERAITVIEQMATLLVQKNQKDVEPAATPEPDSEKTTRIKRQDAVKNK